MKAFIEPYKRLQLKMRISEKHYSLLKGEEESGEN
jgi:hypothetical protein